LIDEIAIYNRTLSDAEIRALYESGLLGLARSTTPLISAQPANQTVEVGKAVTLSVTATGSSPLSYQWYFQGTNAIAGATNQNLTLANVRATQAGRYWVEVKNCAGAVKSQEAELRVNRVNLPPSVAVTNPSHRAIFAPGVEIIISAAASDPDGTVDQVLFYAGSTLLGASASRPFSISWRDVPVGDYVLTAKAIDNDGASSLSVPVKIAVSEDACVASPVALIQAAADPEIETVQDYLFEMGLSAQVFGLAELNLDALKTYPLVLWIDIGGTQSRVTEREVDLLDELYRSGRPIYFMGERLAEPLTRLPDSHRVRWQNLTHLAAPKGQQAGGTVLIEGAGQTDPIHLGRFGTLEDFAVTNQVEAAAWAADDSGLLGRVGDTALFVTNPSWEKLDEKEVRTFTQNIRLTGGGAASVQERKEIFQNAVWWLLRCLRAGNLNLKFEELTATPDPAKVGAELTYTIKIGHSGGTQATGVIVTNLLPRGVEFVSAETTQGSWRHESGLVTFRLGRMTSASTNLIKITVKPHRSGVLTNYVGLVLNEADGKEDNVGSIVTTVEGGPRLRVTRPGNGQYELRFEGEAGRSFRIQASNDLFNWRDVTNVTGGTWSMPLIGSSGQVSTPAFYRAVSP
jgi:uncharacterized repeat protein (TIGR01451 family)